MNFESKIYYGWFSQKQKQISGDCIYLNLQGHQVIVSCASETKDHGCSFDDINFVDMVKEFVAPHSRPHHRHLGSHCEPFDSSLKNNKCVMCGESRYLYERCKSCGYLNKN